MDCRRRLWVDALCVNQSDEIERAQQVLRMRSIYTTASKVIIWLGPAEPYDREAFAVSNAAIALGLEHEDPYSQNINNLSSYLKVQSQLSGQPIDVVRGLYAASRLLARPWFSRLWVVQEVASQPQRKVSIVAGNYESLWLGVRMATVILVAALDKRVLDWPADSPMPQDVFQRIVEEEGELFSSWSHPRENYGLWSHLRTNDALDRMVYCYRRRCLRPHDRIYAVYGWLELHYIAPCVPDYDKNIGEVYHDFIRDCLVHLQHERDFDQPWNLTHGILALVGTEEPVAQRDTRPSWVPHLHYLTARSAAKWQTLHHGAFAWSAQFHGRLTIESLLRQDQKKFGVLELKGKCFATVKHVLLASHWSDWDVSIYENDRYPPKVQEWYNVCRAFVAQVLCADACDDYEDALDLIFSCGIGNIAFPGDQMTTSNEGGSYWSEPYRDRRRISLIQAVVEGMAYNISGNWNISQHVDRGRQLCTIVTHNGDTDVAWVPTSAQMGDTVCVFAGAPYPYLVREASEGRYMALGDVRTVLTTLRQALGGNHVCKSASVCQENPELYGWTCDDLEEATCNYNWDSEDAIMQDLIANMGWMILQ